MPLYLKFWKCENMKEETRKWVEKVDSDIIAAKDNLNMGHYDLVSFLCQQAVEKILKACLIEKNGKFPKIHDLVRLGKLCEIEETLLKECESLTFIYTGARYPDIEEKYTKEESENDIKTAEKVIKWIKEKLLKN